MNLHVFIKHMASNLLLNINTCLRFVPTGHTGCHDQTTLTEYSQQANEELQAHVKCGILE